MAEQAKEAVVFARSKKMARSPDRLATPSVAPLTGAEQKPKSCESLISVAIETADKLYSAVKDKKYGIGLQVRELAVQLISDLRAAERERRSLLSSLATAQRKREGDSERPIGAGTDTHE